MAGAQSPWIGIPAHEYEAHMAAIGQAAALRDVFARVYAATRPRSLLILGCTTGADFELVDPAVTARSVGVDVNDEYLAIARRRLGTSVELVQGDVLEVTLPSDGFDLVHAALLFEYVDAAALFRRIAAWLGDGGICSTVTQDPVDGVAAVSRTPYASLGTLDGRMTLREHAQVVDAAARAGLACRSRRTVALPHGKRVSVSIFARP
jgi:SAM-dependent methyltransferase